MSHEWGATDTHKRGASGDNGAPVARAKRRSMWTVLRDTGHRSPSFAIGITIIGILVLLAISAPVLTQHDPTATSPGRALESPNAEYWFGTDELGRDLFSRTLYGARASLLTGALATFFAAAIGVPLGLLSGYFGKWVDALIMRAVDVQVAIPAILLALIIIVLAGRGFTSSIIAVGIASIPLFARIVRASTMSVKEEEFVTAVKALGGGRLYTMIRTILPNLVGPIIIQMVVTASVAILLEAALSYLGLGTQPPTPTWGDTLRTGQSYLHHAPYYAVLPGLMLTVTVLALDLTGRGLQTLRGGKSASAGELEARS